MLRNARSRLSAQEGFTMVTVMGVLLVVGLLVVAAFAATNSDIFPTRKDQDSKLAYEAAEAGLANYQFQLNADVNYWTKCATIGSSQIPVNNPGSLKWWRSVNGGPTKYAIELLPQPGKTCSTTTPAQTVIDARSGTFRVRVTGRSRNVDRTIVATFRRDAFLDYIYFTNYETSDPSAAGSSQNCAMYYRDNVYQRFYNCAIIQFAPDDVISGPFHTNDEFVVCGSPTFGRSPADAVETASPGNTYFPNGWMQYYGCSGSPDIEGTFANGDSTPPVNVLSMPPSTSSLKTIAGSAVYTGTTTIVLNNGGTATITNANVNRGRATTITPPNGVIYVANSSCSASYRYQNSYNNPTGCGDVWLKGNYDSDLTISAENDIIVNGDVNRSGGAALGLIANNNIRVYHPVSRGSRSCSNSSGSMYDVEIDAAILSLQHSFIVDNYECGSPLGTLTVNGAIAQNFRGPVGTSSGGGGVATGYIKNYVYDDTLRYHEPPYFISPISSQWKVIRQVEQVPPL